MARGGIASRRRCEEIITQGRVTVDGEVVDTPAFTVLSSQLVTVDGKRVTPPVDFAYLALHKPPGYVSTVSDPQGRPTVMDLLPEDRRLFPVGRLDLGSEGLLLATDDGDWADGILHPSGGVGRVYRVLVGSLASDDHVRSLASGIRLSDGVTSPARVQILDRRPSGTWLEIELCEGRNRQIRRMLSALGYSVARLIRVAMGPVKLADLPPGEYRELERHEILALGRHRRARRKS